MQWWAVRDYDSNLCVNVDPRTAIAFSRRSQKQKNGFTMVDGIHCGGCAGGVYEYTQFLEPAN